MYSRRRLSSPCRTHIRRRNTTSGVYHINKETHHCFENHHSAQKMQSSSANLYEPLPTQVPNFHLGQVITMAKMDSDPDRQGS